MSLRDHLYWTLLSTRLHLGKYFWAIPALVLIWPLIQFFLVSFEVIPEPIEQASIQNWVIGLPLNVLAIGIGIGLIANEIEGRTLEVTYTIAGGAQAVWLYKLAATTLVVVSALVLLVIVARTLFTSFPAMVVYRAFQAAVFFLVLSMGFGVLLKNKLTAAMFCGGLLIFFMSVEFDNRWSPMFNPLSERYRDSYQIVAWQIQNHIAYVLLTVAIALASFSRAERRELLLKE